MDETAQLIEEQKKNLPTELVRAIEETAWEPVVQKIGQENALAGEKLDILEREVMLALYAFEPLENLSTNIARELEIPEETANKISDSVWERIMGPINRRVGGRESAPRLIPEIASEIHPMVEPRETVHDVPNTEESEPIQQPTPKPEVVQSTLEPIPTNTPIIGTNFMPKETPPITPTAPKIEPKPVSTTIPTKSPTALTQEDRRYPGGVDPYREPVN